MIEDNFHIAELLYKRLTGSIGEQERQELETWARASEANRQLMDNLLDGRWLEERQQEFSNVDKATAWDILRRHIPELKHAPYHKTRSKRSWFSTPKRWTTAAVLILLLSAAGDKLYRSLSDFVSSFLARELVISTGSQMARAHVTLHLAGGSNILLGDMFTGWLAGNDNTDYYKMDDNELGLRPANNRGAVSEEEQTAQPPPSPDTLETSKGASARINWSDGTSARLNAASSLIFLSCFTGEDRQVELTGEGFFDVKQEAPLPSIPAGRSFTVQVRPAVAMKNVFTDTNTLTIKAFSTRFNVRAYKEDSSISAGLESGSIYIQREKNIWRLDPGQVYVLNRHGASAIQGEAFSRLTVPWKDGQFSFNNEPVHKVLGELGRWYNATIIVKGALADSLTFEAPRSLPVSDVLHQIGTLIDNFHYKISADTITVWH